MKVRALLFAALLALSACSDDETSVASDVGSPVADMASDLNAGDLVESQDSGDGEDAGDNVPSDMSSMPDAALDMTSMPDAAPDAAPDATIDMATADPYEGRPLGQCVVADDCPDNPNGKICNRNLPGGSCGACGNDTVCDDECLVGTCITTCGDTADCPPGLRCTSTGRCGAQSCVDDVCPVAFFGCSDSGLCTRIDCSADASMCPAQTSCIQGLCIEDRMLNQ